MTQPSSAGRVAVVLGLPADTTDAQAVVDAVADGPGRTILLWERTGHSLEESADGLAHLELLPECWVLNKLLVERTIDTVPSARVAVAALGIPDVFFEQRWRPAIGGRAYAAFLGRFSRSKGAAALAARWAEEVWPATGLQLVLAGRGLHDGPAELAVAELQRSHPGIRTVRLMSERARARFLAHASLAVFPAAYDYAPQALAEAVSAGTPVMATDILGHRGLAPPGRVATVVEPNLDNLVRAVVTVLKEPSEARRRTATGRRGMLAEHSEPSTRRRLDALLSVASQPS